MPQARQDQPFFSRRSFLQASAWTVAAGALSSTSLIAGQALAVDGTVTEEGERPESRLVGELRHYQARQDDTLVDIATRMGIGFVALRAANPDVDVWLPGEGTEIVLPTQSLLPPANPTGIVINLPEMRLYHFREADALPAFYPIGIGREGRTTPLGSTRIERKTEDPTWYPPESIKAEKPELPDVVPPGPENPLGTRALYLGWPAYLIHGTNNPYGIGRRASAGCIRMYPEDVESLYPNVPIGTDVQVLNEPVKIAWVGNALYLEVHPTQKQADQVEISGYFEREMPANLINRVMRAAGKDKGRLNWQAIEKAGMQRPGYPIQVNV